MKKGFMIFLLVLIAGFMVECQNREMEAELNRFKAAAETETQNLQLAKLYIQKINEGKFDGLKEILSPGYRIFSPSGYAKPTSRDKLIENYNSAKKAFSEFTWKIQDIIAAKEKVICRISISGLTKGGVPGLPGDAMKFKFSMITILRFEKGIIVEEWQEDDQLGFVRQLGMELKPKKKGKNK